MINFSGLPITSLLGIILRKVLSLIPPNFTVPILQGPLRGTRWIVGAQTHGMWLGSYEIDKQLAIKNSLKPGQVFYDIGANVGYYSLLAAKCVGNTGAVIAFEPLPRNIVYLTSHLRLNKITNTILLQKALSDHSGKEKFSSDRNPSACHLAPDGDLEVTVITLDELLADKTIPPPDIIKVDIEGAEIDFCKGAIKTLMTHRPLMFMAVHSPELFVQLVQMIAEYKLPYTARDLENEKLEKNDFLDEVILVPC